MNLKRTERFVKDYAVLTDEMKRRTEKAISGLLRNPHYPSLRIKKMEGIEGIWELRISDSYRLTLAFIAFIAFVAFVAFNPITQ